MMASRSGDGDERPRGSGLSGALADRTQTYGSGHVVVGKEEGTLRQWNQPQHHDVPSPLHTMLRTNDKRDTNAASIEAANAVLSLPQTLHWQQKVGLGQSNDVQSLAQEQTDAGLWDMSDHLLDRFEEFGDLADLQQTILILRRTIKSTQDSNDKRRAGLASLGVALRYRFDHLGELDDIEGAISTLNDAVRVTPHGHPDRPVYLSLLGSSLTDRFERIGESSDLEEAISILGTAVELTPHGHPDRPGHLNDLGNSFLTRFERFGELSDLENALARHRDAVDLTLDGPDKPTFLSSLGNSFFLRFACLGELGDLENAILNHKGAVDLTSHGHPHKPGHLNNLGNSFIAHFERLNELTILEDAISAYRAAVNLTPHDHPQRPRRLGNLGNALKSRFQCLGGLGDLGSAILILQDAVNLIADDHPEKPGHLLNLGNAFHLRFLRQGELGALEDAISMHRIAVNLVPRDHPDGPTSLNALGTSILTRFERLGDSSDLEDAISTFRDAVNLARHSHSCRPAFLNNLSNSLFCRFKQCGELDDLEHAILSQTDAVNLTPQDHPDKALYLSNLGNAFFARFHDFGGLADLEYAISRHKDAAKLTLNGNPSKPSYLNSLGSALRGRFNRLGELSDLETAILSLKDAVDLTPQNHPYNSVYLSNLGRCFLSRYQHLGELSDLKEAVSALGLAVDLTPHDHPHKPAHLENLGDSVRARFEQLGVLDDLEQTISLYAHAASNPVGPINIRFRASQKWIACAQSINHRSLFHAHSLAVGLLPQLAWIGQPLGQRYMTVARAAGMVREAAAVALDVGFPETAIEWLERGRSIVWDELFQLRNPFEELSSAHPDHALRFVELSVALEHASAIHEKSTSEQSQSEYFHGESDKHHAFASKRDKVLREIRCLPGFERFLLLKEFHQLRRSAHTGPVVMLNAAKTRCDALIILANVDHVIHVPLPSFTLKRSNNLQQNLKYFVRQARVQRSDEREGQSVPLDDVGWESFLSPLWKCVVKPVLDALAFSGSSDLSRIFWCPTGPFMFLPLHAAGFYDTEHLEHGHKVFDFVISSYVPSLAILDQSRHVEAVTPGGDLRLLAVRQPPSDGLSRLPGVVTEIKHIKEVIRDSPRVHTTLLESYEGTVEEVLSLMKETDWVHFACHGIQASTSSGLCLADRRHLKLQDMIALSRPPGGLAFLSACQTATGHERLADEAIHIAAGMLFAGYSGVVGSMWSISDRIAPDVARDVYEQLLQNDTKPDYRDAARALHEAVGRLRESGVSFVEWLPFIHVGL